MSATPRTDAFRKSIFDAYRELYQCDNKSSHLYLDLVPACKMEEIEMKLKIGWCDHSWSPWRGCTKVSPGCANCYAETLSKRNPAVLGQWGKGAPRVLAKNWGEPVKWNKSGHVCAECGKATFADRCGHGQCRGITHRPRLFPSLCDWLDDEVPIEWLARFLQLIHATPALDWLLLTKRPELFHKRMALAIEYKTDLTGRDGAFWQWAVNWWAGTAPSNVWIGTSVEDQQRADERIPALLKIPAKLRFLSVEPMLGPINLEMALEEYQPLNPDLSKKPSPCHWVIVGGESGPGARPCNVDWARSIVRQCAAAGVPCFVKQLGAKPVCSWPMAGNDGSSGLVSCRTHGIYTRTLGKPDSVSGLITHPKGGDPAEWPEDLRVRQFPEVKP